MKNTPSTLILVAIASVALAAGCGDDDGGDNGGGGDGNLTVVLGAEETIPEGLESGDCDECILDGYSVSFSKYIVAVGFVDMNQVGGANPQSSSDVGVAEFITVNQDELTVFNNIATGQYTEFGYETPIPEAGVTNINEVAQADIDDMVENRWSYIIEGTLTQVSDDATIDFEIKANAAAVYTDCALETEPEPGVPVESNSTAEVTIHGDHVFFNGFPEDETQIQRLAAWMWQVGQERDTDGVITQEDFEAAINVDELFPADTYTLTGSPVSPINNAWDFVRAQLGTQGHIFGEGECEWGSLPAE
jgi:hypothetical protein